MAARRRAALTALAVAGITMSGCTAVPGQPGGAAAGNDDDIAPSVQQARTFLDEWVDDGRVVRRDQGDDTVSEGQAYGLFAALVADDEERFDEIWDWTVDELMRDDGLLAWQWEEGEVVDDEPASDAELDAARALVLAGDRFGRDDLEADGLQLADDILDHLTIETSLGRVMLPGLWAAERESMPYNPSYASPAAFELLGERSGDPRWADLAAGSDAATTALLSGADLPPDWAQIRPDGSVIPAAGPLGEGPNVQYGYDAQRVMVRYAESCDAEQRDLIAGTVAALSYAEEPAAQLDLGGGALTTDRSPLSVVARAAAHAADGGIRDARADLEGAALLAEDVPTYYGSAWAMLGAAMLEGRLGGCSPLEEDA
jgi:endoglucanase